MTGVTVGQMSGQMTTAQADTSTDTTVANVEVGLAITLTELTPTFTLSGNPGDTVTDPDAVTMRVTTNNFAGYTVTVQPTAPNLTPSIGSNTDVIPMNLLEVSGPIQAGAYVPLNPAAPVQVARKDERSVDDGDVITNGYRITIPAVRPDTYSGTLLYAATTL
ncbi:hypothetical protein [Streptosporangium sp. 'caverna']|uniref:hypothetical protein n=1 Tax=Streptosporangium sp. 'caverna' TaxID=2202249 RepID=UPI00195503F7|nr:hypothetical protein [Streptosporangium sp. 'caverna']